jgi:phosphate transport system substrate-binding protein
MDQMSKTILLVEDNPDDAKLTLRAFKRNTMLRIIFAAALTLCTALAGAQSVRIGGTGSALGTMRQQADALHATGTQTRISVLQALGSRGAIRALLAGGIEIAVVSRPLTAEETARGLTLTEYAVTPLVFATWPGNPVDSVSTTELADIYAARRTHWPDRTPVRLVLRSSADSDTQLISGISEGLRDAVAAAGRRPGMILADTDTEAANLIERTEGSLGPTSLALLLSERRHAKILTLDGVAPSVKALADGRYRLQKRLYLVTGPRANAGAREFVAFVQSPAGRVILERTGHLASAAR